MTTGQRTLPIASAYGIPRMRATCVGVDGESEVEKVAPVTIGVATGAELVSLNLSTIVRL